MSVKLNALLLAALYTAIIGVGMYVSLHWAGYAYGDPYFVRVLSWVELVLLALAVFWIRAFYNWPEVGMGKIADARELLWLLPPGVIIVWGWIVLLSHIQLPGERLGVFALVGLTTLLVGISEELVYRGVVLRGFLKNGSVWVAMLVSAVTFSLLHSVNYFGGVNGAGVVAQLKFTFLVGLVYAPIAIRLGAIWPLMVLHWLWDFLLIGGLTSLSGPPAEIANLLRPLIIAEAAILWFSIWIFPPASLRHRERRDESHKHQP
ncbi:lysostaphin resistance A-like protein [Profundibacter sp.]|uniref:CPBP family intramembrane glutamic endopeptidase n=1 Tax=Profundibacter sp. TaxID=3101071 RepID=UPI003D0CBA51